MISEIALFISPAIAECQRFNFASLFAIFAFRVEMSTLLFSQEATFRRFILFCRGEIVHTSNITFSFGRFCIPLGFR